MTQGIFSTPFSLRPHAINRSNILTSPVSFAASIGFMIWFSSVTCKMESMGWILKELLLFLILCALNVNGMARVAGINLQPEATDVGIKSQGF